MGSAISNMHKEIYKAARHCLTDRVMAVRCAAAKVSYKYLKFTLTDTCLCMKQHTYTHTCLLIIIFNFYIICIYVQVVPWLLV